MTRRMMFAYSALCALLLSSSSLAAGSLTSDELKTEIVGKTCTWSNKGMSGVSTYSSNGAMQIVMGSNTVDGKWKIKGNRMCDTVQKKETCYTFTKTGDGTYKGSIGFTSS